METIRAGDRLIPSNRYFADEFLHYRPKVYGIRNEKVKVKWEMDEYVDDYWYSYDDFDGLAEESIVGRVLTKYADEV